MKNKEGKGLMNSEWKMVRLGDCTKIVMGQSPSSSSYNTNGEGLPFYQGNADFGALSPKARCYCTEPSKYASVNSILMSVRAPIGALNIANSYCCIGRGLCSISGVESTTYYKYIYYYLLGKQTYIQSLGTGSTFKAVTGKVVNDLMIQLPSFSKQQKIAAVLDKASELVEKRKEQLAELDRLAESIFYDMFGDPVTNEKGWKVVLLEDVCTNIIDCPHSTPRKSNTQTNYPCIRTSELKNGEIFWNSMQYIDYDEYVARTKRLVPQADDIVYGREGTFGDAVILPNNFMFALGQRTMLFRANKSIVLPFFLHRMVISDFVYNQAMRKNSGSTVGHVNVKDVKQFKIISPPLPLQKQFAERIEKIEKQKTKVKAALTESENLFQRLMQDLFNPQQSQ
ncbi:MAG: restriction endonuclease subunit S [Bacteroidales bacterium]